MPSSKSSSKPNPGCGMVKGGKFKHVNIMGTNPLKNQFAPTDAMPIRQRAQMGGDPMGEANAGNASAFGEASIKRLVREIKPSDASDRELEQSPGANDPKSAIGKERIKRINDPVR